MELLSQEEIEGYHQEWASFSDKYRPESPYNVNSGLPVIGQIFQFRDKPIFRAHIFKRKLQKAFDPYFVSKDGYLHPFFHTTHYFFPIEQIYHASMPRLVPNYHDYITTDRFDSKRPTEMKEKKDFKKTNASVELVLFVQIGKNRFVARGSTTFYDDRTNKALQTWYLEGIGELRKYVQNMQKLMRGDTSAVDDLIREIEAVDVKHQKMIIPRNYFPKDKLIDRIRAGEIPEEEIHDFFSFWDIPNPQA